MKLVLRHEFLVIAVLGLALLALIAVGGQGLPAPLAVLRLLLGLAFVLFVPGYALQAALFPRLDELDGPERLALSFGLSIAVIAPIALLLDRLPWGIRLWPIVAGEGFLIVSCAVVTWLRRRRLPKEQRLALAVQVDPKGWWDAQGRGQRVLWVVLMAALLTAGISAGMILAAPKPGERLTEFYILGSEGLAESYPRQAVVGQPVTVTVGIANREGMPAQYRVDVLSGQAVIAVAGPVMLAAGAVDERPVTFALTEIGADVKVEFLLYRDEAPGPYRSLRLWMTGLPEEEQRTGEQ